MWRRNRRWEARDRESAGPKTWKSEAAEDVKEGQKDREERGMVQALKPSLGIYVFPVRSERHSGVLSDQLCIVENLLRTK